MSCNNSIIWSAGLKVQPGAFARFRNSENDFGIGIRTGFYSAIPNIDPENVFAIGYCFGGSVVLNSAKLGADLKGVVSFHGGLAGVPADKALLKARILVCHGGSDKFVPQNDVDVFKHQMDSIHADYKFIVYANATHAFTNPASTATGIKFNMTIEYNAKADMDSWNDMKLFFDQILKK